MAEVTYATVAFKTKGTRSKAKEEQTVYDNVRIPPESREKPPDTNAGLSADKAKKRHHYQKLAYCFGTFCVILLLSIGGLLGGFLIYKNENTNLKAEKENFTEKINELDAEKTNLTGQIQNMETEKKNLTKLIQKMEMELIDLNVSRAQWSINAYCRQEESSRTCKPCENGWRFSQSSCYAINDHIPADRRNWEEARENCREKGSDHVVVDDDNEKKYISDHSWASSGLRGYWIGLRAEHGKWKWVDGRDLAETSWITGSPTDGRCVISVRNQGWKSVRCDGKQRWICEKAALSV